VRVFAIPATKMAYDMGNATFAGVILLGKLIQETGVVKFESFEAALRGILKPKKHYLIPEEMKALKAGADF
jgi:2-oxoglutarate ferredoxin oxidoreductase subunit gamma